MDEKPVRLRITREVYEEARRASSEAAKLGMRDYDYVQMRIDDSRDAQRRKLWEDIRDYIEAIEGDPSVETVITDD